MRINSLELKINSHSDVCLLEAQAVLVQRSSQLRSVSGATFWSSSTQLNSTQLNSIRTLVYTLNMQHPTSTTIHKASEVAKHTESLLMAVSASASQEQSKLVNFQSKLEVAKSSQCALGVEEKSQLQRCRDREQDEPREPIGLSLLQIMLLREEADVLEQQMMPLRRSMGLPLPLPLFPLGTMASSDGDGSSGHIEGDLGFLADILHFISIDSHQGSDMMHENRNRFTVALDIILGSKLSVRVCQDGLAAERIMRAHSMGTEQQDVNGMRIWPIDRLTITTERSKEYLEVLRKYSSVATDPTSLVGIALDKSDRLKVGLSQALFKAVERWVIVDSEKSAALIIGDTALSRHIQGCVTLDGDKHSLGSLVVGNNYRAHAGASRHELQVERQMRYRQLNDRYNTIKRMVLDWDAERRAEAQDKERSQLLSALQVRSVAVSSSIETLIEAVKDQSERATAAHKYVLNTS